MSPCFVCVLVRCRSDLSASAVLYAHDRYCRGLGRVLVLIIHDTHERFDLPAPDFTGEIVGTRTRGKTTRDQIALVPAGRKLW